MNLMGSSLDKGRISEFQDISYETCQSEMQRKKNGKQHAIHPGAPREASAQLRG